MSVVKVRAVENRVIVKRDASESTTPGGIMIPEMAQKKAGKGKVVAVGPGRLLDSGKREEINVKVGDVVYFSEFSGAELKIGGEDFVVFKQPDIYAIVG